MRRTLRGTRVLITGASGGIGARLAEQAVRAGARVLAVARSTDRLDQLVRSLSETPNSSPGEIAVVSGDITVADDRRRALQTMVERFGGLDALVNNAGVASFGHFIGGTEAILRQVMEVNFFAPAELIREAIPFLRAGNRPVIVNVASMCGRRGVPAWSEYSASKFALCGLTEAIRGELARFDVDVTLIVPGLTRSDLSRHMLRNEGKMKINYGGGMPPERVARDVLRALCSGARETVLGWEAHWILRVNRFLPQLVDRLMARRVRSLYAS
jgi:short-subunit dehydrogenase